MECTERKVSGDFALYIKHLRLNKGLTLREVAEATNLSASYISRLEKGDRTAPTMPVFEQLAKCYGVSVGELSKIALADKSDFGNDGIQSFETLLYSNQFTISGQEVNTQMKKQILALIQKVAEPTSENEYEDMGVIMQIASELRYEFN